MVLAFPVGKKRNPWRGFWLAVASFTVYRFYWDIKAHDELYKQFELARERRDQGTVWYVMGALVFFLRFVYYGYAVGNVQYLRRRFGMRTGITPAGFLGLVIPAAVLFYAGGLTGISLVLSGLEEGANGDLLIGEMGMYVAGWVVLATSLVGWIVLSVIAYVRLQSDINDLWDGYAARSQQLRGEATVPQGPRTEVPLGASQPSAPRGQTTASQELR